MGVPQLHQREDSLPSSFPSVKPYQRQDNMLRLAALFLLVSAWCLTSEAGMTCADWKGMKNDWKGMMRCEEDVRSFRPFRSRGFAFFMCRNMRDECLKMSDAAAMEDAGHRRCDGWKGFENCVKEKNLWVCFPLAFRCGFSG